ncbi:unnamed protein product [Owenia fusiformis]|uniref:Dephospho-CoA kinase domain-containing protein n=1 Tax=Owenia fusiformis TaxID=6347 RepID=A0A8J1XPJ9_OWEFU|nr:unnamed protein product [Owenia fusiformis]
MYLIGLTGGIASGKSTVSKRLAEFGCPIIDADLIAREVVEPGKPAWRKIKETFGADVFFPDGQLDRKQLGEIVFSDENKRNQLNTITHREIAKVMILAILKCFASGCQFAVLDVPLLFETKRWLSVVSKVVVVTCDDQTQLDRLMNRDDFSIEEAQKRINVQMPLAEKCKRATHIIDNSKDIKYLNSQVNDLVKQFQKSYEQWKIRSVLLSGLGMFIFTSIYLYNTLVK